MVSAFSLTTINNCSCRFAFRSTRPPSSRRESDPPQKKLCIQRVALLRDEGSLLRDHKHSLVAIALCFTAKKIWFAAMEHWLLAVEHCFVTSAYSFAANAHCFTTIPHSSVTDRSRLCRTGLLRRVCTLLCGISTLVCGYRVLFLTKEHCLIT